MSKIKPYKYSQYILAKVICLIMSLFFLENCAVREAPSGGPPDKTPPDIISTFPKQDSINISHLDYLEIQFTENIDRASVKNQVWLLPELPNGFDIKWKGSKKMQIVLNDSLEKNQTYILTVGTGVKDFHSNNLSKPVVVPFATGPTIDKGEISGVVLGDKVEGTFIYAYQSAANISDTLIFTVKPKYFTQVDKNGGYQIGYLKPDQYRVFALKDENGDRFYTLQTDWIGIPFKDVVLDSQVFKISNINFALVQEDTTAPKLVSAKAIDNHKVEIKFNEPVKFTSKLHVEIEDSMLGGELKTFAYQLDKPESPKLKVYTGKQTDQPYFGNIKGVMDLSGNSTDGRFSFIGTTKIDTTSNKLVETFPVNKQKRIRYDSGIQLTFSYPVDSSSLKNNFQLLNHDSIPVMGKWQFSSFLKPRFIPNDLMGKFLTYTVKINLDSLENFMGNSFGDSVYTFNFETWDWGELGEISGRVYTGFEPWSNAIIEATFLRGKEKYTQNIPTNKLYKILYLPDGQYNLSAIIDVNNNGRHDKGQSIPFKFSEPFMIHPDTVHVRKRWTNEGINFNFDH